MNLTRLTGLCTTFMLVANVGCSKPLAETGTFSTSSATATATGEYARVDVDSVERMSIENGKLVLHGASRTAMLDLPSNADPDQTNRAVREVGARTYREEISGRERSTRRRHPGSLDRERQPLQEAVVGAERALDSGHREAQVVGVRG